jgi:hypothetical protein
MWSIKMIKNFTTTIPKIFYEMEMIEFLFQ